MARRFAWLSVAVAMVALVVWGATLYDVLASALVANTYAGDDPACVIIMAMVARVDA
jgi:hypothetical protein